MGVKRTFVLAHDTARRNAVQAVQNAPEGHVVTLNEPSRSSEQNALLWAMLHEISDQVVWHGRKLSPEDWKHVFSSSLRRLDVVPNLEGTGFVALGLSTSKLTKSEFSDLTELIHAFAAEHGVELEATA